MTGSLWVGNLYGLNADFIGRQLYPSTLTESVRGVVINNFQYPPGWVPRYMNSAQLADFLAGTSAVHQDSAIQSAIAAVGNNAVGINLVTTYTGGVVYFPKGNYLISYSQAGFLITTTGLVFQGEGGQYFNNYKLPATAIIVDGTGSVATDYVFKAATTENARGLVCKDIAFQYKNGFAGDYFYWGAAGVIFQRCTFSSTDLGGPYSTTCNSFFRAFNGHHYRFRDCSFSDVQTPIIIDNALAANTNDWSILGCAFYDCAAAFISNTGSGALGVDIGGCTFDPLTINPTNGINLGGVGINIHGCLFAGTNTSACPANSWITINGDGVIEGNAFTFQPAVTGAGIAAVLVTGGNVKFEGNRVSCTQGLIASGAGNITGGGNNYQHLGAGATDIAVQLSQNSASYTNIGPDTVGPGFLNSYSIGGSGSISGFVNYSPDVDSSTNGPIFTNTAADGTRINPMNPAYDTVTTGVLTVKMTGKTFSAAGGTYTLPASTVAARGLRYRFLKLTAATVTINAGAGTSVYDTSAKANIADSTAGDIGASITIEYVDNTHAVVIAKNGTWV